jgi:hypothetical protein
MYYPSLTLLNEYIGIKTPLRRGKKIVAVIHETSTNGNGGPVGAGSVSSGE